MEYTTLSNGVKMPMLGYGVYQVSPQECERCVLDALHTGYRSLDTAQSYFNEAQVGSAIRKSGVPREDIFLTTKVWVEHYGQKAARASVLDSMQKLGVDYLDLVLLHQPFADYYGAWRAMERLYEEGAVRAIGVSNFSPDRLVDLCLNQCIRPMVNQIELHPFYQQPEALQVMESYGVVPQAWGPLSEAQKDIFQHRTLMRIAQKKGKSTAQVILRWHLQRGIVAIPKSTHIERMKENLNVFDFALSDEDMQAIASLDKEQSSFFSHSDPNMVEWFVKTVEERKKARGNDTAKKSW